MKEVNIEIAPKYLKFVKIAVILWSIILLPVFGLGLILFLIYFSYKKRILNRTKIVFSVEERIVKFYKGGWFVVDDDTIPINSIDNIKLDRSLIGNLYNSVGITIETRSEKYKLPYVSAQQAEEFRKAFIELQH
ncbi:MAG: PH domain-containing protein [Rhizobiales bacterium]|nr:PH domain-containing protein [Hyphomicrobiales bacterium]